MKPMKLVPEKELLLRSLNKKLSEGDRKKLDKYLETDPALRSEADELASIQKMMTSSEKSSFKPFFSDRVMKRMFPGTVYDGSEFLFKQLAHMFLRFAFAASVIAVLLGAYNVMSNKNISNGDSIIENVFSLPDASLTSITQNTTIISYQDISDDHSN